MAITTAMCNTFKQELLGGVHDLDTNSLKVALIKASPSGTYGAATTNYSDVTGNSDEASGTNYSAGGQVLDSASITLSGSTENEIRKSHSDFDQLRESDEFHDWADAQPKWVRDALYENADDPASVVRVIDLYKSDKGLTNEAKKANRKAAASPVSKRSKTEVDVADANGMIRESEVARMTDKEFEERADEINKAMRSGKFVYDVSGNAR